jgi:L-lactate dehydrogenase complex protein LldE
MPSGSCVHHVRHHLPGLDTGDAGAHAARVTMELCEFIAGPLGRPRLVGRFPHRVAVHLGCHAQRGLRLGGSSERGDLQGGPIHGLLSSFAGIELVIPARPDECCGFGGVFAIDEPDVSVAMGRDRLTGFAEQGAGVLVSSDPSCLLHLEGIARHQGMPLRCLSIAELLEEATR